MEIVNVIKIHSQILLTHKWEWKPVIGSQMDEIRGLKGSKAGRKTTTAFFLSYAKANNNKNNIHWHECRLGITRGWGGLEVGR